MYGVLLLVSGTATWRKDVDLKMEIVCLKKGVQLKPRCPGDEVEEESLATL